MIMEFSYVNYWRAQNAPNINDGSRIPLLGRFVYNVSYPAADRILIFFDVRANISKYKDQYTGAFSGVMVGGSSANYMYALEVRNYYILL